MPDGSAAERWVGPALATPLTEGFEQTTSTGNRGGWFDFCDGDDRASGVLRRFVFREPHPTRLLCVTGPTFSDARLTRAESVRIIS